MGIEPTSEACDQNETTHRNHFGRMQHYNRKVELLLARKLFGMLKTETGNTTEGVFCCMISRGSSEHLLS